MAQVAKTPFDVVDLDALPEWQRARWERIVDAAMDMLVERPYEQIQIRDIAAAAEVSLGTLYRYFDSKEFLYAVVLRKWHAPLRKPARNVRKTASRRLRSKVHLLVAAFAKQPNFFHMQRVLQTTTNHRVQDLLQQESSMSAEWLTSDLAVLDERRAQELRVMVVAIATYLYDQVHANVSFGHADAKRVADRFIDLITAEIDEAETLRADAAS